MMRRTARSKVRLLVSRGRSRGGHELRPSSAFCAMVNSRPTITSRIITDPICEWTNTAALDVASISEQKASENDTLMVHKNVSALMDHEHYLASRRLRSSVGGPKYRSLCSLYWKKQVGSGTLVPRSPMSKFCVLFFSVVVFLHCCSLLFCLDSNASL